MTELEAYRLAPPVGGGFHFGRLGMEQEETAESFPSDSLFAALLATLGELHGAQAVNDFVESFPRTPPGNGAAAPPFLLSSAFPYVGEVLLLPKPRLPRLEGPEKEMKRLRYVSAGLFRQLVRGEPWKEVLKLQNGLVWIGTDEKDGLPGELKALAEPALHEDERRRDEFPLLRAKLWVGEPVMRVTVDRRSSASAVYRIGRTSFAPGCGIWFGVRWLRPGDVALTLGQRRLSYKELFGELLAHLADRGLGGERSVGLGMFTPESGSLDLPAPDGNGPVVTLSRYHPRPEEVADGILKGRASYELVAVAGWLNTPGVAAQRRKRVWLVEAGALLNSAGPGPWGDIVDVAPEYKPGERGVSHPVWRYGLALGIGVAES